MPLRGESVGTAYIRLLADGTGLPDSIRDELEKADDDFADAGRRNTKSYKEAAAAEMKKGDETSLSKAFTRALAKDDVVKKFFSTNSWKNTQAAFENEFGDLGTRAANAIREKFTRAGTLDGLEAEVESVVKRMNEDVDRLAAENKKANAEMQRSTSNLQRALGLTDREFANFNRTVEKTSATLSKSAKDSDRDRNLFQKFGRTIDNVGEAVGRISGKGSRNDFLNFLGSSVSNLIKLVGVGPKFAEVLKDIGKNFGIAQEAGEKLFPSIIKGFSGAAAEAGGAQTAIGQLASAGPAGFIALAAAIGTVALVLPIVAALISGIAAAVTALAASIAFAVVGALAPLLGLIAPIAIGIGAVVAGIVGMNKEAKKTLKEAVQPLVDGFKELGKQARAGFFSTFKIDSQGVADVLRGLNPLIRATGASLGRISTQFINGFKSDNFDRFTEAMTTFVPHALESLATSFQNLAGAVGNIFVDLIPSANRFLRFLERITRQFERFTVRHPAQIIDFFDQAADSASQLGGFLLSVVNLLSTLFASGKDTGDSIFKSLTENINEFADSLKAKGGDTVFDEAVSKMGRLDRVTPKKDPLAGFFKNGKQVADDLGDIAVSLGKIFDTLDSPEGRQALGLFLGITKAVLDLVNVTATLVSGPIANVKTFFSLFARQTQFGIDKLRHFKDVFSNIRFPTSGGGGRTLLLNFTGWIPGAIAALGRFSARAGGLMARAASRIIHSFDGITGPISGAANAVVGFFVNAAGRIIAADVRAANGVVRVLRGIPGRLAGLASQFGGQAAQWASAVYNEVVSLPGRIVDLFRHLAGDILGAIGTIDIGSLIKAPSPGGGVPYVPGIATGGIVNGPQLSLIGEAGAEAVVPLTGPLSQVDPAVRELSAIARGLHGTSTTTVGSLTPGAPGKTIQNEWHITTLTPDTVGVANELLNRMAASGY